MLGISRNTTCRGLRADPYAAFLKPAQRRPNLSVECQARVQRIEVTGGRATAVVFRRGNTEAQVTARREIVLAAGAVNSPQILQLSGIGNPAHLRDLGIAVVVDLPGVGQNLQDHLQAQLVYECTRPISINDDLKSPWRKGRMAARYLFRRTGPIAGGPAPAGAFARSSPDQSRPDLQFPFHAAQHGATRGARHKVRLHVQRLPASPVQSRFCDDPVASDRRPAGDPRELPL